MASKPGYINAEDQARPCSSCMTAIRGLGIRDIYYTANDGHAYEKIEKYSVGGAA